MRDSEEITRPLAVAGKSILLKYLEGKMSGGDNIKVALAAIQNHTKMKATEANDDTNKLGLAKMIFSDPKLREKYVRESLPHMLIEIKNK